MSDEYIFVLELQGKSEIQWMGNNDTHDVHVVIYSDYGFPDAIAYAIESNDYGQTITYAFNTIADAIYWADNALA